MAAPTVGAVMADILPYLGVERSFSPEEIQGKTTVEVSDMIYEIMISDLGENFRYSESAQNT